MRTEAQRVVALPENIALALVLGGHPDVPGGVCVCCGRNIVAAWLFTCLDCWREMTPEIRTLVLAEEERRCGLVR